MMRRYLLMAGLAFAIFAPSMAHANGWLLTGQRQVDQHGFRKRLAARAAPWYLYWPYDQYFTVPAPTGAIPQSPPFMSPGNFDRNQYHNPQPGITPHTTNGYGQ